LLLRQLAPERERRLHGLLGDMFESNGKDWLRAAHHLIIAGDQARGIALLIGGLKKTWKALNDGSENMDDFLHAKRPYFSTIVSALSLCESLGHANAINIFCSARWYWSCIRGSKRRVTTYSALFQLLYRESG